MMQAVVQREPLIAHAVRCMTLSDQLELTLEVVRAAAVAEDAELHEALPANVIRFRPRHV
jgi:hypothetical protein